MSPDKFKLIQEILKDAVTCPRLTDWEETFLDNMRKRVKKWGEKVIVSEAQWEALQRIEQKVYAT